MEVICIICLERMISSDTMYGTLCGHVFHSACLDMWLQRSATCPQCRNNVIDGDVGRIYLQFGATEKSFIEKISSAHQNDLDNMQAQLLQCQQQNVKHIETIDELKSLLKSTTDNLKDKTVELAQERQVNHHKRYLIDRQSIEVKNLQEKLEILNTAKGTMEKEIVTQNHLVTYLKDIVKQITEDKDNMAKELVSCQNRCSELEQQNMNNNTIPLKEMIIKKINENHNIEADNCKEIAQIQEVADDVMLAGVVDKIAELICRYAKLEQSMAECSKRFMDERAIRRTLEAKLDASMRQNVDHRNALLTTTAKIEDSTSEDQLKIKTVEPEIKQQTKKIETKIKKEKTDVNRQNAVRANRAPLGTIEQNCRYNLRPR